MASSSDNVKFLPHHKQKDLCTTRAPYRQGRKLTAVKVYTVNNESVHLLINGVPSIGLQSEVLMLCERYGRVKAIKFVDKYSSDQEKFNDVFHIHFERIQSARFAKKILDCREFYGGILHVCYAPELETIQETKQKLINRKREIAKRTNNLNSGEGFKHNCGFSIKAEDTFKFDYYNKLGGNTLTESVEETVSNQSISMDFNVKLPSNFENICSVATSSSSFHDQIPDQTSSSNSSSPSMVSSLASSKNQQKKELKKIILTVSSEKPFPQSKKSQKVCFAQSSKYQGKDKNTPFQKKATSCVPEKTEEIYVPKPSSSQNTDKPPSKECNSLTNDKNAPDSHKRLFSGPTNFLPRSLLMKKIKTSVDPAPRD